VSFLSQSTIDPIYSQDYQDNNDLKLSWEVLPLCSEIKYVMLYFIFLKDLLKLACKTEPNRFLAYYTWEFIMQSVWVFLITLSVKKHLKTFLNGREIHIVPGSGEGLGSNREITGKKR
jgi:hypothetical protein